MPSAHTIFHPASQGNIGLGPYAPTPRGEPVVGLPNGFSQTIMTRRHAHQPRISLPEAGAKSEVWILALLNTPRTVCILPKRHMPRIQYTPPANSGLVLTTTQKDFPGASDHAHRLRTRIWPIVHNPNLQDGQNRSGADALRGRPDHIREFPHSRRDAMSVRRIW